MILNEQLIQDMFQDQPSRDLPSLPREDISLNFTVSSRSSKNHKKSPTHAPSPALHTQPSEIVAMAQAELAKFEAWMQSQGRGSLRAQQLSALVQKIEGNVELVQQEDLMIIKGELFKHEEQPVPNCSECSLKNKRLEELESRRQLDQQTLARNNQQLGELKSAMLRQAVGQVGEYLLAGVENNTLKCEINQLHSEINALRNEKITLERTFLFNKTRNSELTMQKSKDLSAAKNSTNSSEVLTRNHETIVFIDPIESDVEEWIKFFDAQKNRYRLLCRKELEERQKQLGRAFTREEKEAFEGNDKLSVLLHSIKEILRQLLRIRDHTAAFQQTELARSGLKGEGRESMLRDQVERLHSKLGKTLKINEYLLREKQNLEEINCCLKQERLRENNHRNALNDQLKAECLRVSQLLGKVKEAEEAVRQANHLLIEKEEELLYAVEEVKKLRRSGGEKSTVELESRCKLLEKKHQEKLKEYEFERNSYIFKLKKEALERRKYYNEIEEMKGSLRICCKLLSQPPQDLFSLIAATNFHKMALPDPTHDLIYDDIKRLIVGAFDGFPFTIFNYGSQEPTSIQPHSSYDALQEEHVPTALRVLREIFRMMETEKEFRVEPSLSICEAIGDRLTDLMADRHSQGKEEALLAAQLPQVEVESLQGAEQAYGYAMERREQGHLVVRVGLEVHNLKTNEKYRSRISLVELASPEKLYSSEAKAANAVSKCLVAFGNREKLVPCREHRLTQVLKDSFNANSKIMVIVSMAGWMSKEEVRQAIGFAESCRRREEGEEGRRRSISRKNI